MTTGRIGYNIFTASTALGYSNKYFATFPEENNPWAEYSENECNRPIDLIFKRHDYNDDVDILILPSHTRLELSRRIFLVDLPANIFKALLPSPILVHALSISIF